MILAAAVFWLLAITLLPLHGAAQVQLTVTEPAGVARQHGHVTSGVPFPMGILQPAAPVRLVDEQGRGVPLQVQTTATWRDGSVKWLLLDFQSDLAANATRRFALELGVGPIAGPAGIPLRLDDQPDALWVETGPLRFSITKRQFGVFDSAFLDRDGDGVFQPEEAMTVTGLRQRLTLAKEFADWKVRVLPPDEVKVEEAGPLRAVVRVSGWMDNGSTNRLVKYLVRVQAFAGSPRVQVDYTVTQLSDRLKMLWVRDLSLTLAPRAVGPSRYLLGGQPRVHEGTLEERRAVTLTQLREGGYTVTNGSRKAESGFKAPGWVDVADERGGVLIGNRFFWQQFPKAITLANNAVRIGLYPEEEPKPFDMDQGLAKTHELSFEFHAGPLTPAQCAERVAAAEQPLFAVAPAQWYCDSKVFGDLQPFDFDRFPDYETLTEAAGDSFIKRMAAGLRHWGDVYYGGEYKGTNSYTNLEYDMHHNFYCQFARTGLRKCLDTAVTMAKHQADIDTNHKTGWQWKHSPRHVEIQAEFGHTFTRGLLETYFLTGNRRCRETAIELGDYFAKEICNPRALGNERQIGWSLISLLPVYEGTWDPKYLEAVRSTVERLLTGLDAKGKFTIRWDNRIAFFNGIAATGFLYYYHATGDERVAEAALRVIRRARGFYPEYNGRTLEAIAWAYQRTREPEWLDFLARTWETTLARQISWNVMELGAPTIFTVHALPFLAESGFVKPPERPLHLTPAQFDSANGLFARHLPVGDADLYLEPKDSEPFDLVVIRKGAWKSSGKATLYDPTGRPAASLDFPKENTIWQRQTIRAQGASRLALRSPAGSNVRGGSYVTWDVVTSRPTRGVFTTPDYRGLEFVTPALFAMPSGDRPKIELQLVGEGEGFKRAVIYDPDGNVAGSVEGFIDLGDKGRYHYAVSASIPPSHQNRLWKITLQDLVVEKLTGVAPYFATSPQAFFCPDRPAGPMSGE